MSQPPSNASSTLQSVQPFLKWAGGKQRLLPQYTPHFPPRDRINRYFEPFVGSAAVFFHRRYAKATLSDRNEKLIELYRMVQNDVEGVIAGLKNHRNEAEYYYRIRGQDLEMLSPAERAARLIYLNRTCYNGLFRENKRGEFNVPFGRYRNPAICDEPRLRAASLALKGVGLSSADFAGAVANAGKDDFVYFDPPYVPLNATSSFTSYDRRGFAERDHRRLADTIHQLTARGCLVMLSNSDTALVRELYRDKQYRLVPIEARRNINSKGDRRGPVAELLILNYTTDWST